MSGESPIIVDLGSGCIKAGFQTDAFPPVVVPSVLGRPRRRFADQYDASAAFVGQNAGDMKQHLSLIRPIDHGHIENWADMEEIWRYIFDAGLQCETKGRSILLTEPPLASSTHRETLVETMVESFEFDEVNLSIQGIMTLYSTGRTTGLVVEVGEGVTQIVPASDGFMERSSIRRMDFGGQELTMYLQKLLCDNGYPLTRRDDVEIVQYIKETLCYCALEPAEEDGRDDLDMNYTLPDGKVLKDGGTDILLGPERFYCPEVLFEPRIMQRDNPSLTELIWQAVQASPIETRKGNLSAVIFSGGSSMFPGLPERLEHELKKMSPPQARSVVKVIAKEDRRFGVWLGAKAFCDPGIRRLQDLLWITKDDWFEEGPSVVGRKTPIRR